ncbi:MAG: hypothetical protein CL677_00730 [Bdellovibrionaceae bacterium]|nr:hypothetical protein [Pseudobdellovibrionaceae bacterium]|tara:strand:- start:71358 stop:71882 length:525 start_codon:yes stop_codon:yes gene_type:complete
MRVLFAMVVVCFALSSFALTGKEFVDCYSKALSERAKEIKASDPDIEICSEVSLEDKDKLVELYTFIHGGQLYYYDESAMGEKSVRFHYERIQFVVECYNNPSNIGSLFIKGLGSAVGVYEHTNMDLSRAAMEKMLGRDLWEENGSEQFSSHAFEYCKFIGSKNEQVESKSNSK